MTHEQTREATRARLLDAAEAVFADKGFFGSAVEEIAERAGYSKGAFYFHFEDKAALFLELWERRSAREQAEIDQILGEATGSGDLLELFRERAARRGDDPSWLMLEAEFWLFAMRHPDVRPRIAQRERALRAIYARAIESYFAAVELPPPAPIEDLALIVHVLGEGTQYRRFVDPENVRATFFDDALEFLAAAGVALSDRTSRPSPSSDGGRASE